LPRHRSRPPPRRRRSPSTARSTPDARWRLSSSITPARRYRATPPARIAFWAGGNELHPAIPRAVLGLPEGTAVAIDFTWVDGALRPGEIMGSYTRGDVAPDGRFRYRCTAE
jgi:hypothetical protein